MLRIGAAPDLILQQNGIGDDFADEVDLATVRDQLSSGSCAYL